MKMLLTLASWLIVAAAPLAHGTPTVKLWNPASSTEGYAAGSSILLSSSQTGFSTPVQRVDFYDQGELIGSDDSGPFDFATFAWSNIQPGFHAIVAKAVDANGVVTEAPAKAMYFFSYLGDTKATGANTTPVLAVAVSFPSMAALKADTTSRVGKLVHLEGYNSPDDGGEALFYGVSGTYATTNDVLLVNNTLHGLRRMHTGELNINAGGAQGSDGYDDTAAIQKVLDTRFDVKGNSETDVYEVGAGATTNSHGFRAALRMYSGQKLNLNNATLKLVDGSNSSVIMNDSLYNKIGAPTPAALLTGPVAQDCTDDGIADGLDDCIAIYDGTIDGNQAGQRTSGIDDSVDRFAPTIYLGHLKRSTLRNLNINNFYGAGIYFGGNGRALNTDNVLSGITVRGGLGAGIALNGRGFRVGAVDIAGARSFIPHSAEQPWGIHANSMTVSADSSAFVSIKADDCDWGFKQQDGSENNTYGSIEVGHTLDGQAVKFQGGASLLNGYTTVDSIVAHDNQQNGLYVFMQAGLFIGSYEGVRNGQGWTSGANTSFYRDVLILRSVLSFDTIDIVSPKRGAIESREIIPGSESADNLRLFGVVTVQDAATVDNLLFIEGGDQRATSIDVSASGPFVAHLINHWGATGDPEATLSVLRFESDQPMTSTPTPLAPFQVQGSPTGQPFVQIPCAKVGGPTWQTALNTSLTTATGTCP